LTRLLRASIEDFKRVELVALDLTAGGLVEIAGSNGAGKSSVLDAVEAALGGARYTPAEPIRRGRERARVVLETEGLAIERVWTAKTDRLVVKTAEGFAAGRPQEHLDGLIGPLAFDPIAFCEQPAAEQRATLLRLVGVDLDSLDREREEVYQERRDVNRELKAEQARLDGMPEPEGDAPGEEVSVADLTGELAIATSLERQADDEQRRAYDLGLKCRAARTEVERLAEALRVAKAGEAEALGAFKDAQACAEDSRKGVPDLDAIRARLAGAEGVNQAVRARRGRKLQAERVEALAAQSAEQTEHLDLIDGRKADLLAEASMPVEGLAVSDDGVTYGGVPLDQASQAERIRVGVAIAAALSPGLRLALVRQGNDLDAESLAVLRAEAERLDLQVLLERIVPSDAGAVVIEAGRVLGAEPAAGGGA
jgi:DNA repair exonuclease SbcCD ATPase subunit